MATSINGKVYETFGELDEDYYTGTQEIELREVGFPDKVSIVKVVCGLEHKLALSDNGMLYVWGCSYSGELGIPPDKNLVLSPTRLKNHRMGTVLDIAALPYGKISVALGKNNKVFIWGECMGQYIREPLYCNLTSLSTALIQYSSWLPRNKPLILEEKQTSVASHLQKAFDDSTTSDLIMEVDGKPIHVHKAILKIRSQYFRTMFQDHWKENEQNVILHDQYSYDVYKGYLNYLYTDKIDLPDIGKNIAELMKLADTYNEISLMQICKNIIVNRLTSDNVMVHYSAAVERNDEEIQERCFAFALDHLAEVVRSSSFMQLEASAMKPFIIKLVENDVFEK